eukprot:GHVU01227761.1.p1 GENE.GHVU01227761.1~~GHVU01227761.1.p1  ORF type:complete len:510 (-),score=73.28 GHVU01227761.1:120-1649(-)
MSILDTGFMEKVYGVSTDGCPVMTGVHNGVHRMFTDHVEGPVVCVTCPLHFLNLVTGEVVDGLMFGSGKDLSFPDMVTYMRDTEALRPGMTNCPALNARWISVREASAWFYDHFDGIDRFFVSYPAKRPSPLWWCRLFFLRLWSAQIHDTMVTLQGARVLPFQQVEALVNVQATLGQLVATELEEEPHPFTRPQHSMHQRAGVLQRQPTPGDDGISRIDGRRKDVNNTWVYIQRLPVGGVDGGPNGAAIATRHVGQQAALQFLDHAHTQSPHARAWDVNDTLFRVSLEGALAADYKVAGRQLKSSLDVNLGGNYVTCCAALDGATHNKWMLQVIELGCLTLARLQQLVGKLNRTAPKVAPAQIARMTMQEYLEDLQPHMERLQRLVPQGEEASWLLRTLQDEFMRLQRSDAKTSATDVPFEDMWRPYMQMCPTMCTVACGLATIYANDSEIERVYAEYKYLFSERRRTTSVFSMTGSIMCKQINILRELVPPTPDQVEEVVVDELQDEM